MALFPNPFRKRPSPGEDARREAVRAWAGAALGHPEGLELTISEVECPDPTCPGTETFILVMRKGEASVATKIKKPLAEVDEADVRAALKFL